VKRSHAKDNLDDYLLGHTRKFWQSRLGRELSSEDARQIAANMTGFFSVLAEWSRAVTAIPANDPGASVVSEPTKTET
jgi:hypothetical protein